MRMTFLAALFVAALASQALAAGLSPTSAAFLHKIGINPRAHDVIAVEGDVVSNKTFKHVTLDSLAAMRDQMGVKRFIATRNYIRAFEKSWEAKEPRLYSTDYLTPAEVHYMVKEMKKHFCDIFQQAGQSGRAACDP
jgi:hypothetical protein